MTERIPVCPDCGKRQALPNFPCWLCGRPLGPEHLLTKEEALQVSAAEKNPAKPIAEIGGNQLPEDQVVQNGAWSGFLILWVCVGGRIAFESVPLGIAYFVLSIPAIIVIWRATVPPEAYGSIFQKVVDDGLQVVRVLGIVALIMVGLFGALFLVCIANPPRFGP